MRVIIVGAGVVGAATAYFVAKRGHDVTLLDQHAQPAQGASFANAGQLSYSYTDTLADPGLIAKLPAILLGRDSGMHIRFDSALLPWGVRFLWQCTRRRADRNTLQLLRLAAKSAAALEELLAEVPLEFGHRPAGKLMLTSSPMTLQRLQRRADLKRNHGVRVDIIDAKECVAIEPALAGWRGQLAGAAYAREDSAGDAQRFTRELCAALVSRNLCKILTDIKVHGLERRSGRIIGVQTSRGLLEADATIVCAGTGTPALLKGSGARVSIYPLKGYSVTPQAGTHPPSVSLTDLDRRIVFANLDGRVRLAGLADCVGGDATVDMQRVNYLVQLGQQVMPEAARFDASLQPWAGLRPATPSGVPMVGATAVRGLYLNVGHGALGWTLACGTGQLLAEQLTPKP